jgi:hypothetical protein
LFGIPCCIGQGITSRLQKKVHFHTQKTFHLLSGAGKELKALLQADDELFNELSIMNNEESNLSTQSANSTHRKRKALQASGMDEIINHIDKVSYKIDKKNNLTHQHFLL